MLAHFLCIVPSDYRTSYIPCDDCFAALQIVYRAIAPPGAEADLFDGPLPAYMPVNGLSCFLSFQLQGIKSARYSITLSYPCSIWSGLIHQYFEASRSSSAYIGES